MRAISQTNSIVVAKANVEENFSIPDECEPVRQAPPPRSRKYRTVLRCMCAKTNSWAGRLNRIVLAIVTLCLFAVLLFLDPETAVCTFLGLAIPLLIDLKRKCTNLILMLTISSELVFVLFGLAKIPDVSEENHRRSQIVISGRIFVGGGYPASGSAVTISGLGSPVRADALGRFSATLSRTQREVTISIDYGSQTGIPFNFTLPEKKDSIALTFYLDTVTLQIDPQHQEVPSQ